MTTFTSKSPSQPTSKSPSTNTRAFARVLGPFLVITPVTALVRSSQMRELLADMKANPLWPWVLGAFVLILGLVVVALHNIWSNPPAVIVSVIGWLMVVRGIVLLAFPAAFMSAADAVMGSGTVWRIGYVVLALIGLYLTAVGWKPAAQRTRTHSLL